MSGFRSPVKFNTSPVVTPTTEAELRSLVVRLQNDINEIKTKNNKVLLELERAVIGNLTQVINNVLASGSVSVVSSSNMRFGVEAVTGSGSKTIPVSPAMSVTPYTIIGFVVYSDSINPFVTTSSVASSFTVNVDETSSVAWIGIY